MDLGAAPPVILTALPVDTDVVSCNSIESVSTFVLGIFICLGMFVSYAPQHYKIISSKSSEGFSPWFLLLGCLGAWSNVLNIVILQWDVIRCCTSVPFGICLEHTLGIAQIVIQWTMFILVFILFLVYFPAHNKYVGHIALAPDDTVTEDDRYSLGDEDDGLPYELESFPPFTHRPELSTEWRTSKMVAVAVVLHFLATLITSVILMESKGVHHPKTRYWANLLGVFSMCMAAMQYFPQIWRTWQSKTVGALSIPMMLLQTPGSFVFVYTLASLPGTNWTTWITYLVSGILQGVLLCLCITWNLHDRKRKHGQILYGFTGEDSSKAVEKKKEGEQEEEQEEEEEEEEEEDEDEDTTNESSRLLSRSD